MQAQKSIAARLNSVVSQYEGVSRSTAYVGRSFHNTSPNMSVRSEYNMADYDWYRQSETLPAYSIGVMKLCNTAYRKVPIVRNVIDMMSDFTVQGIRIVHPSKNIERFYNKWAKIAKFKDTSERIANTLYRLGNCPIKTRYGKVTSSFERDWKSVAYSDDVKLQKIQTERRSIPLNYTILNPWSLDVIGGEIAAFINKPIYAVRLGTEFSTIIARLQSNKMEKTKELLDGIPDEYMKVLRGGGQIILDPDKFEILHYKKDDWQIWATPMLESILDQLGMMEKLHLADKSALDGAISQIRLWKLGNLDKGILPTRAALNKLKDILASMGTGVLDLVWGPDLEFQESSSSVYNFLGSAKYEQVMSEIYAGLGVPPALTGSGTKGSNQGFTNNYVSIKTLVERLEYVRNILVDFWERQFKIIQLAMGFNKPAEIIFDYKVLANESTERDMFTDMFDRNVISMETLRELIGRDNEIEDRRVKREHKKMDNQITPPKASPFHNPQTEHDYKKIVLQNGGVAPSEVGFNLKEKKPNEEMLAERVAKVQEKYKPKMPEGRPSGQKDKGPRKQKKVKPKTKPSKSFANLFIWANNAQQEINKILTPFIIEKYGRQNLRQLSKSEAKESENLKFNILSNIKPYTEISQELVYNILNDDPICNEVMLAEAKILKMLFKQQNNKEPSLDEIRQIQASAYAIENEENN